jgi:hypothetical protein
VRTNSPSARQRRPLRIAGLAGTLTTALLATLTTPGPAAADPAPAGADRPALTWNTATLRKVYAPPSGEYSYAPSVIRQGATTWTWTCHNAENRVIRDHIYLEKYVGGQLVEDHSVLQATEGAWDSFHTCDPTVVAGHYRYGGILYRYAMFYLGNDLDASAHNQIGVAFATGPDGPWIKYPQPIVAFADTSKWGVGQPSAISEDPGSGKVTLFYTQGDTSTRAYWRDLDFTDMGAQRIGPAHLVTIDGLTGWDGSQDWLNNYDIAYDPSQARYIAVREQHPYPTDNPWWIGQSVQVVAISSADLRAGSGGWQVLGTIDAGLTGLARNHNAGLVRTATGRLPNPRSLTVVFTSSCAGTTCDSLYSYDLWQITGGLG